MRIFNLIRHVLQKALLVACLIHVQNVAAECEESYFPIYAGGAKGSEDVRCFAHDSRSNLIIVGGVSDSVDFVPTTDKHGYLFALDMNGNWKWGSYFAKSKLMLASIEGCKLSSDGKSLVLTGLYKQLPALMLLDVKDGSFKQLI